MDAVKTSATQTADKFIIRFPQGMRKQISEVAKRTRRSMNSEIICRLEHSLVSVVDPVAEYEMRQMLTQLHGPESQPLNPEVVEGGELMPVQIDKLERALVESFRQLPTHKKTSLLALLAD